MKKPDWKNWIENLEECKVWLDKYIQTKIIRKSADESNLYLRKVDHNLNLANWIIEKHKDEIPEIFGEETFYDWVINIYYYAVYHSALALMNKEGYMSKNHSATICFLIYYNYHLQKIIDENDVKLIVSSLDKEDIETLGSSKELRERASYDIHEFFEKELANQTQERTLNFINKIKKLLKED